MRRCAAKLKVLAKAGGLPGFSWRVSEPLPFEHTVKPLTRMLVDNDLSCGCWIELDVRFVPPPHTHTPLHATPLPTPSLRAIPRTCSRSSLHAPAHRSGVGVHARTHAPRSVCNDGDDGAVCVVCMCVHVCASLEQTSICRPAPSRSTHCSIELWAPAHAVASRRPSVLQFAADHAHQAEQRPQPSTSMWSHLPDDLRSLAVHTQVRSDPPPPSPPPTVATPCATSPRPFSLSCYCAARTQLKSSPPPSFPPLPLSPRPQQVYSGAHPTAVVGRDPVVCITNIVPDTADPLCGGVVARSPGASPLERRGRRVVFTTHRFQTVGVPSLPPPKYCAACVHVVSGLGRLEIRMFKSERSMLRAWQHFVVVEVDPDIICGFDAAAYVSCVCVVCVCVCALVRVGGSRSRGLARQHGYLAASENVTAGVQRVLCVALSIRNTPPQSRLSSPGRSICTHTSRSPVLESPGHSNNPMPRHRHHHHHHRRRADCNRFRWYPAHTPRP